MRSRIVITLLSTTMSTMSTECTSSSDPLTAQLTILYAGRMAARFQCLAGDSLTEAQLLAESSASNLLGRVGILRYKIHGAKYLSGGITTFGLSVVRNSVSSTALHFFSE